jgi:hypothetical protein
MIQAVVDSDQLFAGRTTDLVIRLTNAGTGKCTNIIFKLSLPHQLVVLRGSDRVEIPQLGAGETVVQTLQIRPEAAGTWAATSRNFSYRDKHGRSQRVSDFLTELTVVPDAPDAPVAPEPEPSFRVRLTTQDLLCGEWQTLRGRITNTGAPPLNGVSVGITGPVTADRLADRLELGTVPSSTEKEFTFYVYAKEPGAHVPVHIRTTYVTESGLRREQEETVPVRVGKPAESQGKNVVKILYLSANPTDSLRLKLSLEQRQIAETLRLGRDRGGIELHERVALRVKDLTLALLDIGPRIVHFSGHGASDGRLYLETEGGRTALVPVDGLAALFREVSDTVKCVIVNACDSEKLARAIVEHVDYVIGMRHAIGDQAAILFSTGFYQALAAGREVEEAFKFGCVQIQLNSQAGHEHTTPLLLKRT